LPRAVLFGSCAGAALSAHIAGRPSDRLAEMNAQTDIRDLLPAIRTPDAGDRTLGRRLVVGGEQPLRR
jgi:hypothetical protein